MTQKANRIFATAANNKPVGTLYTFSFLFPHPHKNGVTTMRAIRRIIKIHPYINP